MPNPSASPKEPSPSAATATSASPGPPSPPTPPLNPSPLRGDIYWVNVPKKHIVGHEQYKRRPWLIVSNNAISPLKMVAGVPLSFQLHKKNRQFRISIL